MKEFTLDLVKNYQRPIIKLYGITTLIDTGAVIPTVSLPIPILEKAFNAQLVLNEARIGGFGGGCNGKVFSLKIFGLVF